MLNYLLFIIVKNYCGALLSQIKKLENNTNIRRTFEQREQRDEYFGIFSNLAILRASFPRENASV
jgi:hypothetical protein